MDFLSKILSYYNLSNSDYNELTRTIKREDLLNLSLFHNGEKSLECLKKHIENNSRIMIYGDYDCDGMMATSILAICFKYLDYSNVRYFIPNRYKDGYGLNVENTKKFIEKDVKLIICVDNGVSQFEAIQLARDNGIDVIICDHHELSANLPNTPYIIHPALSDAKSICSGGYTSYVLAEALLGRFDEYLFCLAAISIISDLMVLHYENRDIVKFALEIFQRRRFKQIDLLAENNRIDENIIGSLIAPKINSIGRMIDGLNVNLVVKYFLSDNINEIIQIHSFIEAINKDRKALTTNFVFDKEKHDSNNVAIEVLDAKEGLIGLFANKILELCKKPSIVFTRTSTEGILKGSIRSKIGISVLDIFKAGSDYIIACGGHECAGGFSIYEKDYEKFSETINSFCEGKEFTEDTKKSIEISLGEITLENLNILETLKPFGNGFKAPEFLVKNYPTRSFDYSIDKKHIITKISLNSTIIQFNYNNDDLNSRYVDFVGTFRANYFKNRKNVNFIIKKIIIKD